MNEIVVIGGGAVGLFVSASCAEDGQDVTVVTRTKEQMVTLREQGIELYEDNKKRNVNVKAATLEQLSFENKDVILAVKSHHIQSVLNVCNDFHLARSILFLQNGMGHVPLIQQFRNQRIVLVGSVEHGIAKESANGITVNGRNRIRLASYQTNCNIEVVKDYIESIPSLHFQSETTWKEPLIEKLVINACINPLTALYRVRNGVLIENPLYEKQLERLYEEIETILQLESSLLHKVKEICKKTAYNQSSMLKDIMNGRKTEIEAILGYILENHDTSKQNTLLLSFLYDSIRGMDYEHEKKSHL